MILNSIKAGQLIALWQYSIRGLKRALALSLLCDWFDTIVRGDSVSQIFFPGLPEAGFYFFMIVTCLNALFRFASFEFIFTRAVNRIFLFYLKSSIYLVLCLTPLAVAWISSYAAPALEIKFSNDYAPKKQELTKRFYVANVKEAYVQIDNKGNEFVVLPKGRIIQSAIHFILGLVVVLYIQYFFIRCYTSSDVRWGSFLIIAVLFILVPAMGYWGASSAVFEVILSWLAQHLTWAFLILGILTLNIQYFCCRSFVGKEIF